MCAIFTTQYNMVTLLCPYDQTIQLATKVISSDRVLNNSPTDDSSSPQRGSALKERSRSWFGLDLLKQAQVCILYYTILYYAACMCTAPDVHVTTSRSSMHVCICLSCSAAVGVRYSVL
jgi:hypothetical protein